MCKMFNIFFNNFDIDFFLNKAGMSVNERLITQEFIQTLWTRINDSIVVPDHDTLFSQISNNINTS